MDIIEQNELNKSMQDIGATILLNELNNKGANMSVSHIGEEYAVLKGILNDRQTVIFTKTVMYPENYETAIVNFLPYLQDIIFIIDEKDTIDKSDIFAIGLGSVQKYVADEEKGIFRIGGKYAAAFGTLQLIKKAENGSVGYTPDNPLPVDSVAAEYAMLENVMADNGVVIRKTRVGSVYNSFDHIVDKWVLDVSDFDGTFRYSYIIYMDPYAECSEKGPRKLYPDAPFGEWNMPNGFKSLWFDYDRIKDDADDLDNEV